MQVQKLFRLLYSATLGILVVVVTKIILDSAKYAEMISVDALTNTTLFDVIGSIRGDISLMGDISAPAVVSSSVPGDMRHHVYTPPVGTELEANDQAKLPVLFSSGDGQVSLGSRDQFSALMTSRSRRLREVCNSTTETNRKFNFRSFYVLKVKDLFQTPHIIFTRTFYSEPVSGLVSCLQGSLHQLDAQPALPGRQERVRGGADYGGASQVRFSRSFITLCVLFTGSQMNRPE